MIRSEWDALTNQERYETYLFSVNGGFNTGRGVSELHDSLRKLQDEDMHSQGKTNFGECRKLLKEAGRHA